jgi:N-acetylglucosaminyl-diphospho-decaprenol L-rhamnosyltransferase
MQTSVSVVIVAHNCPVQIAKCIASLQEQTRQPDQLIIVDSGSDQPGYLRAYEACALVVYEKNIGFAAANNSGLQLVQPGAHYVLFLNPDAFLTATFLEQAINKMAANGSCGVLTGQLLGFDFTRDRATGCYDSTGIFHTWYGRWYDRGQGIKTNPNLYDREEFLPAVCGALMFCRKKALDQISQRNGVWDSSFFMYKEDIDLSLRLRKYGWQLLYHPELKAYHGRGWKKRSQMARHLRLYAARNEWRLHWKERYWKHMPYSLAKYALVKLLDI